MPHTRARVRAGRGFSMVELTVSFGIFLLLASFITLALARSFSTAATLQSHSQATQVLSDQLDKLNAVPYADLVSGDFTVPDACDDTENGIGGDSCVEIGGTAVVVSYGFKTSAADTSCDTTDARRLAASHGYVTVNGCVTSVGSSAFASTASNSSSGLPTMSRQMNAPEPGAVPGSGTVRVQLTGDHADLPGRLVLLVHPARVTTVDGQPVRVPITQVTSATVDATGLATLRVDNVTDTTTVCDTTNPCALALSADTTPTITQGNGRQLALVDTVAAGADATFTVTADAVTEVTGRVTEVGTATLDLVADKDGQRTPNPTPGSVCVWVTFPDAGTNRTVPACNTDDAGAIHLDTYEPDWESFASLSSTTLGDALADADETRTRYPFPTRSPLRVTLDHPAGTCPYAPGMVGSRPGTAATGASPASWAPLAVCTSYTWGLPTRLDLDTETGGVESHTFKPSGVQLRLRPGTSTTGALVWNNALLAPGTVGYGPDLTWDKPRTALGCAADASCSSVLDGAAPVVDPTTGKADDSYPDRTCLTAGTCRQQLAPVAPEATDCPAEYCYSTVNSRPFLLDPATGTYPLTGITTTFTIDVRDSDDDADTISAAVASTPTDTVATVSNPTRISRHTRRYEVAFTDNTGTADLKVLTLSLTGGSGARAQTTPVALGLYHQAGAWQVSGPDVMAAQGDTGVPVRVHVTSTAGTSLADAAVTFTTDAPGVTITDATTDSDGYATGTLAVPSGTPAGTYQVTASVNGGDRTGTVALRVSAVANALELSPAQASIAQGGQTTVQAYVTDGATGPATGVVVNVVVTDPAGVPTERVYPTATGCVTGKNGTCTVDVVADDDATAGSYVLGGSTPTLTATPRTLTVTPVPARATTTQPLDVAQGQTLSADLAVLDGADDPIADTAVSLTAPTGVTVTPATSVTAADGSVPVAVTAAADAPSGKHQLSVAVGGRTLTVPLTVSAAYGRITSDAAVIDQGALGELHVTVLAGNGDPVPETAVAFSLNTPGITYTPQDRTDTAGRATSVLDVAGDVPTGDYPAIVTVGSHETTVRVTVSAVPASVSATGALTQGETGQVHLTVHDLAGDAVPNLDVTVTSKPATFALTSATAVTDDAGVAVLTVTDTGSAAGTYSVAVAAGSLAVDVPVTVLAAPGEIQFTPAAPSVPAGAETTVTVTVTDRAGAPYPNAVLEVTDLPPGVTVSAPHATDINGASDVTFTSAADTVPGSYPIAVTTETLSATPPWEVTVSGSGA